MVSVITCPCCRQEQLNQFSYDGGVKEWFDCPACDFGCSGKILADDQKQELARTIKEYQDECLKQCEVAKARTRAIKKGAAVKPVKSKAGHRR